MRLIPKSIVVHQLGGDRACWTASLYILRGADWNVHAQRCQGLMRNRHQPMESHTLCLEKVSQLNNSISSIFRIGSSRMLWGMIRHHTMHLSKMVLQQLSGIPGHSLECLKCKQLWSIFQSWLAAQGLCVQDGIMHEDNLTERLNSSWNDSSSTANT